MWAKAAFYAFYAHKYPSKSCVFAFYAFFVCKNIS